MSNKIFKSVWSAALAVFAVSLALILGLCYSYFSAVQVNQLKIETQLAARGAAICGMDFFTGNGDEQALEAENYRVTWIASDGSVLYDSAADESSMENHLAREEVQTALAEGYGESSRYSATLSEKQLYAAQLLPDGTVLRLSIRQAAVWTLLLGFLPLICVVILFALALSFLLAYRLSKKIVEPINALDLDHPLRYVDEPDYREIAPLLRRLEEQQTQLKSDQEKLERTSLIRQEFTANASHELKTPLHAISGYAELLENGMVRDTDVRPFAGKIRAESQRMTKLVEDIIDLTALDNGGGMQREDTDLYRIAENAIDSLESTAEAAQVTLRLQGESAPLRGIPSVLYSIIYNLCDNGIRYNHAGGHVTISVEPSPGSVTLTVQDDGIGIPQPHQERIFERFYQVDKSHSKAAGGTGLGLSIVKRGALLHHAAIALESVPDKGSAFTVTFPAA
ncbi:MAG: ATP-binding protein [Oscillospiraceae bacterium]|nr:ATP-binding protein [Oscillospiraceae bacterium]